MSRRTLLLAVALGLALVLLSGCAGTNPLTGTPGRHGVAGFWSGLWHGMIVVISFVISLFNHHVRIYEVHNNGLWYDFGFLLGIMMSVGGAAGGRRRR